MPRKQRQPISYFEKLRKLAHAGILHSPPPNRTQNSLDDMPTIEQRVDFLLGIVNKQTLKPTDVLFFVMYDIESNKVRRYVVKYLQAKGCTRVQRSIFLANLDSKIYEEIKRDLAAVQAAYDNQDSIFVVPISSDYLQAMKIIGQSIELDVITKARNTLFF